MWNTLWGKVPDKKSSEKRAEARLASCMDAWIWITRQAVTAHTKDISATGVRLQPDIPHNFVPGEQYRMQFQLPDCQGPINVTGRVVRVDTSSQSNSRPVVAFHFVEITSADQKLIREFVLRRRMERRRLDIADLPAVTVRTWVDGKPIPSFTKDISALGIKIQLVTTSRFHPRESYTMEIELPGSKKPLHVTASVVRIDERPNLTSTSGRWQVAFEFTDIAEEDKKAIRAFVVHDDFHARAA